MTVRPSRPALVLGALSVVTLACGLACSSESPTPMVPGTGGTGTGATGGVGTSGAGTGGAGAGGASAAGSGGAGVSTGGAGASAGGSSAGSGAAGSSATGGVAGTDALAGGAAGAPGGGSAGATGGDGGSPAAGSGGIGGMAAGAGGAGSAGLAGSAGSGGSGGLAPLPDPGTEGDGDFMAGPSYPTSSDLMPRGNPAGRSFSFSMPLADSEIFDGTDPTLDPGKVNTTRSIQVYVPAAYMDGDPAPVLIIQDGPGQLNQVKTALDNLTVSQDPMRKLPPFVVVAVQNGGSDAAGSERGLEYDTMSDRYARFIELEVMPAVAAHAELKQAYPNFKFTRDPSGRASLGCSSGGSAAFTMAWFRPDLFSRVVGYGTTLVATQDQEAPEAATYPHGAWDYHSDLKLIENDTMGREKFLRVFINANQNDLGANDPESTRRNWLMANQRTAAALKAKGYHYRYVQGQGAGHCDAGVTNNTLADALVWVWRGYVPSGR